MIKKLRQFFCRHKNTGWYGKKSMFMMIGGETHYKICNDCGKELGTRFLEYEGSGYK